MHGISCIPTQYKANKSLCLLNINKEWIEKQFKEGGPTEKWWRGFKKRHPDLSLRTSDSLDRRQSRMANKNVVKSHFNLLKKKKKKNTARKRLA